jgi:hypothetical protein
VAASGATVDSAVRRGVGVATAAGVDGNVVGIGVPLTTGVATDGEEVAVGDDTTPVFAVTIGGRGWSVGLGGVRILGVSLG